MSNSSAEDKDYCGGRVGSNDWLQQVKKDQQAMAVYGGLPLRLETHIRVASLNKETGNESIAALITGCIDIEHLSVGCGTTVVFRQKVKT